MADTSFIYAYAPEATIAGKQAHMFSVAYVILPDSTTAPADAIRASLAPF
jgi:hypothetical protein